MSIILHHLITLIYSTKCVLPNKHRLPSRGNDKLVDKLSSPISPLPKRTISLHYLQLFFHIYFKQYLRVADIIRSCLGPKAMLEDVVNRVGGFVLMNDGYATLRAIEVAHFAAMSMIELSHTRWRGRKDGMTTVIILGIFLIFYVSKEICSSSNNHSGEMLAQALPQLERNVQWIQIISAFKWELNGALQIVEDIWVPVNNDNYKAMYTLIQSSIGTNLSQDGWRLCAALRIRLYSLKLVVEKKKLGSSVTLVLSIF